MEHVTYHEVAADLVVAHNQAHRQPRSSSCSQHSNRRIAVGAVAIALVLLSTTLLVRDDRSEKLSSQRILALGNDNIAWQGGRAWEYPPADYKRFHFPARKSSGIETTGSGRGWPLQNSATMFQKAPMSEEEEDEADKGRGGWLNVGTYGQVPRMNGDLDGQLEDPQVAVSCRDDPIAVECTGGFGGGMKSTGGPMATRIFWRQDNALGWRPEVDGPLQTPRDLKQAFRYLYGDPTSDRTRFSEPRP